VVFIQEVWNATQGMYCISKLFSAGIDTDGNHDNSQLYFALVGL